MRRFFLGLVIGFVIAFAALPAAAQPWNLRIVDNAGDMGYNSRIVVTSDGTPCILYVKSHYNSVYLAWWVPSGPGSGSWGKIYVDNGSDNFLTTALVADSNDNLHLSWYSSYKNDLFYAVFNTSTQSWVVPPEVVVSSYYNIYPAIGVVENGGTIEPVITYVPSDNDYLYSATRDSLTGTWSSTPIYTTGRVGSQISMAVGSTGWIYVSFYEEDGDDLMYATRAPGGTTWGSGYIDITGDVGKYNSIVIDENDTPHVVYYDATNGDLKYAKVVTP